MTRYVELRRHTDNDGDALSEEGVRAALEIGRELAGGYELLVSSGAQRATQTLACFACMLREPVPGGAVVEAGLRSRVEDRWRAAYERAGSGDLAALRGADPELVREDAAVLGAALRRVLERLSEGGRALAVGHSPTNEAAVLGLTGSVIGPWSRAPVCSWSRTPTQSGPSPWHECASGPARRCGRRDPRWSRYRFAGDSHARQRVGADRHRRDDDHLAVRTWRATHRRGADPPPAPWWTVEVADPDAARQCELRAAALILPSE